MKTLVNLRKKVNISKEMLSIFFFLFSSLTLFVGVGFHTISFLLYVGILVSYWTDLFSKFFGRKKTIIEYAYGLFMTYVIYVFFAAIIIVYGSFSDIVWVSINGMVGITSYLFYKKYSVSIVSDTIIRSKVLFKKNIIPFFLLFIGCGLIFALFIPSTQVIFSPWQVASSYSIYIVFLLFYISGLLIYSQWSYKYVLIALIAVSFASHIYLAKSHVYPWGGDVWRMIGVEQRLVDEEPVLPVLFGGEMKSREIFGVAIPEAFLIPNKYAYGHMWASVVVIAKNIGFGVESINKWLMPIFWSIFSIIFFYQIGISLFKSRRFALLLAWSSLLLFTFQVLGAITLPNSFGFLYFLFVLSLLIKDAQKNVLTVDWLILGLLVSSLFGYSLYAMLLWVLWVATYAYTYLEIKFAGKNSKVKAMYLGVSLAFGAYVFPLIDIALQTTYISTPIHIVEKLKQFIGGSSGLFISKYINHTDTPYWNILFNHVPDYAFVGNIFTNVRWHIFVITIVIGCSVLFGIYKFLKDKNIHNNIKYIVGMLFVITIVGYIFGWHILEGDRTFVRRLDPLVGLVFIIFGLQGVIRIGATFRKKISTYSMRVKRSGYLIIILIFSWYGTTVYALGPDIRSTSQDEYIAGDFVSNLLDINAHECVVASTEVLLVIESKTQAYMVGGNFDIDYQFGQSERVSLYNSLYNDDTDITTIAHQIFKNNRFDTCYIVLDGKKLSDNKINELLKTFGEPIANKSLFTVWSAESIDFFSENE